MSRILTPQLGRRHVVRGLAAVATSTLVPNVGAALAAQQQLVTTPSQTVGPFYPTDWSGDADNDLVRVVGEAAQAQGQLTHILGRVLDASGTPIPGAAIEIWQCDATGIYRHPRDTQWLRKREGSFPGRGRATADAKGAYSFRTIKPVAYPGRTPHIHFAITAPGREPLITQMYVAGEAQNERDGILNGIRDARQRDSVIVSLRPGDSLEPSALMGTFDIVLAG
ncbi:MAG: protocatechuate 3,4-dioxygenase [Hyphomicrobium sp.]|nr:protocatechuate 3,4-dioxygenase [Hyphomicrobium sp.]